MGAVGRQGGPANHRHIRIVRRLGHGSHKGSAVPGSEEKGLPLRGVLQKDLLGDLVDVKTPGATQLLGQIIGGHAVENVIHCRGRSAGRPFLNHHFF
jgi:hypothetical protein